MGAPVLNATPPRDENFLLWFSVRLFDQTWDIGFSAAPIWLDGVECWGTCVPGRSRITLDPTMAPELRRLILLHELSHASAYHYRRIRRSPVPNAPRSLPLAGGAVEETAVTSVTSGGLTDALVAMGWKPPRLPAGFKAFAARRART
jgi:hypothetical protein